MNGITVRGTARTSQAPDRASVHLAVDVRGATAADAHRAAGERMRGVLETLAGMGLAPTDIATQQVELSATYDYHETGQRLTGYQARQSLAILVRDIGRLAEVIDRGVAAGADQVTGVSLFIGDAVDALREVRAQAVADARVRAESLARAAGVGLGAPTTISEVAQGGGPIFFAARSEAMAADTPIAPGSAELVAEVEVVFAIEPVPPAG